jgi:NifB/MoaA-like Fe-S oxidoreductase
VKRIERRPLARLPKLHGTILTGMLFAPTFKPLVENFNLRFGTQLIVEGVENKYFGGDVSVAGLLTGGDLVSARERLCGEFVIIPRSTLKSDEEIMLDGMKLEELTQKLGLPVRPCDLKSFADFLFQQN